MRAVAVAAALLLLGVAAAGPGAWVKLKIRYEVWRLDRDPDARCRVADVLLQKEMYAEALEACDAVLRRVPDHPTALMLRREVVFCMGPGSLVAMPTSCGGFPPSEGLRPPRQGVGR